VKPRPNAGLHAISSEDYHADRLHDRPSLSSGTIKRLLAQSPEHARANHPRLNPDFEPTVDAKFDVGTAAHRFLLEPELADRVVVVDAPDWRTKAAREAREAAREIGSTALLEKDWTRVQEMVAAVRARLPELDVTPPLLADGKAEQTVLWEDDGVLCRARVDSLHDDLAAIDDLKTTSSSGNPIDWSRRTFWSIGADIQAVFYQRGIEALTGRKPAFRFIVAETEPPYAISVFDLAPSAIDLAERKIDHAIRLWRHCLETGSWPGYPRQVASIEVDAWQEVDLLHRIGATS
jgi:hypothetical protein